MVSRRNFLASAAGTLALTCAARPSIGQSSDPPRQRVLVMMFDGFGMEYFERSDTPTLRSWQKNGLFKQVSGVMPSVTNANNTSICCGAFPSRHGITGNSYLNAETGKEDYMESASLVLAPTLFQRAARTGVASALLSSKKKTISLLNAGTSLTLTAEEPSQEWRQRLGAAPSIYSREINYWLLRAAIHLLKHHPELECLYIHTTDYPMHTWAPEEAESLEHIHTIDSLLAEAVAAAPDAAFLLTADHGIHHKTRCYDLQKVLAAGNLPIRIAISAERDKYIQQHRGFGGSSWVYLEKPEDEPRVHAALAAIDGVEAVYTRQQAASKYSLYADRIGDLCVFGDRFTVFGDLDTPHEELPATYRSHGSTAELEIPLFAYNAHGLPQAYYFQHNLDLTRWLYRNGTQPGESR